MPLAKRRLRPPEADLDALALPWKGIASDYTIEGGGERTRDAAWSYRHPFPWVRKIRGHLAFWNGVQIRA